MSLGEALRNLAPASPPPDLWPQLAAELSPRRRRRRLALGLAVAAAAVLVLAVVELPHHFQPDKPLAATVAHNRASVQGHDKHSPANDHAGSNHQTEDTELAALQARSQSLERWLRRTGKTGSPLQGQDLAAAMEIENLIALVDVQLAVPTQAHAAALWRRRIALLEDLAVLHYTNYQIAGGGERVASRDWID